MNDRIGYWIDRTTGKRYADGVDRHGTPFIGDDDAGFWWGTESVPFVLSEAATFVIVSGHLGSEKWIGHFLGTEAEALDFAARRRVEVSHVESETCT